MNDRPVLLRALVVVTGLGLALTGCSGTGAAAGKPSPSPSPYPSTTVSVAPSTKLSAQGTKLRFGQTASVIFEPTQKRGTTLKLTVLRAAKGSIKDFSHFILDDPYKRKANYYYVHVKVKNTGKDNVGGVPVPLWGVNADNVLLPAVNFTTAFKKCPSKQLPAKFGKGASFRTCLVYLSPDHGTLDAVSFRPDQKFNPITWTGHVTKPKPTGKHAHGKKGRKHPKKHKKG
jgi:hypothetical protein